MISESIDALTTSLDSFEEAIRRKIQAIGECIQGLPELEILHKEAKKLLFDYDSAINKCVRYSEFCPEVTIGSHREVFNRLLASEHRAVLEARAKLLSMPATMAREQLIRRTTTTVVPPVDSLAQDISDSLRDLSRKMQDEIIRSEGSFDVMKQSARRMRGVVEQYGMFGGVLTTSKKMIGNLWRRERSDRTMIMVALAFYFLVILYIAGKRLWFAKIILPWIYRFIGLFWRVTKMVIVRKTDKVAEVIESTLPTAISEMVIDVIATSVATEISSSTLDQVASSIIESTESAEPIQPEFPSNPKIIHEDL